MALTPESLREARSCFRIVRGLCLHHRGDGAAHRAGFSLRQLGHRRDIAADEIHLESDEGTIAQTDETQTGAIRHEWTDCSPDTFCLDRFFDLHLPDDADAAISGFDIPSAFVVVQTWCCDA